MERVSEQPQYVFVLGVERSGSTWLANIIDSNDENILFFEPFSPLNQAFPGFPDRLLYLKRSNSFLDALVREGFEQLYTYKYPLVDRHDAGYLRRFIGFQLSYQVGRLQDLLAKGIGMGRPIHHVRYRNLNKNRIENRELLYGEKSPLPTHVAVKELRLNFKVKLLQQLFPEAKFIVIIRNPISQINSCLTQFDQGSLHQLKESLYAIMECVEEHGRLSMYREAMNSLDRESLVDRLVAYWFLNYNILIEDLASGDQEYLIVRHEKLSRAPLEKTQELFDFGGLTLSPATKTYTRGSSRSDNTASSAMDTTRNSRSYYLKALHEVQPSLVEHFHECAERFWPVSVAEVSWYRDWLRDSLL